MTGASKGTGTELDRGNRSNLTQSNEETETNREILALFFT
jgi:hypothetical protein